METKLPVYNTQGKEIETITLDEKVFDGKINSASIHQAVSAYLANQRRGLAATKTRGEVSGGGRKPWKQKGTGRARVGSTRSPLWRHGGVIFGPHPRDFSYKLSPKIKTLALKSALLVKLGESNVMVIDEFNLSSPKTKEAAKIFSNLKINNGKEKKLSSTLLLSSKFGPEQKRALGNIGFLDINVASDTHAYEVLSHKKIVVTKSGLNNLTDRIKKILS